MCIRDRYDTARAFERAGAKAKIVVIRNLSQQALRESIAELERGIRESQIVMIPGGFSGGDEPEGSGKFIQAFFRNAALQGAVHDLLYNRDGLALGICNGFQALIKLGLLPVSYTHLDVYKRQRWSRRASPRHTLR